MAPLTRALAYDLELSVDWSAETFDGTIVVRLEGADGPIELDAAGLAIRSASVDGAPCDFAVDEPRQKVTVRTPRTGDLAVTLAYGGRVRRDVMNGFYVSRFGDTKLFTTMMQPLGCRWLFPCLDHPAQKAVLRLTVSAAPDLTVIANAEVERVEERDGRKVWRFAPTPRMSTYLVYLGIAPFELASARHDGKRVTVATAPGKTREAARALAMAGPIVAAYEDYYRIPYPLPKLDLVAVPDFWAGGMENWGAITFPEIGLLWGDATSPSVLRWAVETLSHEIAHQWFGNLVTMEWWNDIWLNESFATFVAAKMEDRLGLRADAWAEFLIRASPGYFADSQRSTHPVKFAVNDPSEISQNVDDITYFKGANIVRMIEGYLGEETFRRGVSAYLHRFQFGNARDEDLWRALEEASGEPVRPVMGAWIERAGMPVVEVRHQGESLHLRQRRFTFLPVEPEEPPWPIPLTLVVDGVPQRRLFDSAEISVPSTSADRLVINPGRKAFIRVWYDAATRTRMLARLPTLEPFDRWAFLSDAHAFLLSGDGTLEDLLDALRATRGSTDYPSVLEALGALGGLRSTFLDVPEFRKVYVDFHRAQLVRLTLEDRPGEPDTDPILREAASSGLAHVDPEFARSLSSGFAQIDRVAASLRPAVAIAFARQGGPKVLDTLFAQIRSLQSDDAAERAAFALGALPETALLAEALDRLKEGNVRTTHICYIVRSIAANPLGRDAAWAWLQANLRDYEKKAEGSWWLSNLLRGTIPNVGVGREGEVRAYFEREKFPEGSNGVRRGLEMLEVLGAVRRRLAPRA